MGMIEKRVEYLRARVREVLKTRTKNSIVIEIKETANTFHQFNLDRFLFHEDVKYSTIQKIDEFITNLDNTPPNRGV